MIRYAITDRALQAGDDEIARRYALVQQAEKLSREGVDYFQVREKDIAGSELVTLVRAIVAAAQGTGSMKVLVNGPVEAARATGAAGVHLSGERLQEVVPAGLFASAACHSAQEVQRAAGKGIGLVLFSPVFGKNVWGEEVKPGLGLDALREAVRSTDGKAQVLALGGVTHENTQACLDAGVAGIAGIRLFL
jgi:thiamine-phosphate pyrophosphorylase